MLIFDTHARYQMAARHISESDVASALTNVLSRRASYADREEVYGRTLKIVVVTGTNPLVIVTAMRVNPRRVPRGQS